MDSFGEIFMQLINVWKAMFSSFFAVLPKAISFLLWVISAIFILPCVYIAGELYPMWVKWGEDL